MAAPAVAAPRAAAPLMALNSGATLDAIASLISGSGYAVPAGGDGYIGDPKGPPDAQPSGKYPVSVRLTSASIEGLKHDGSTTEQHTVTVTVYGAFIDSDGVVERRLSDAVNKLMAKLTSDADLGVNIRHIDVAGILGPRMGVEYGYKDISGTQFRVAEIQVPMVVDGNMTVTA
tara:strand:+ start:4383 stop:4904 length:522 start_codon:yes stop_codon:yes gene_type:complete